jgi:signal transduction histidine kinase
MQCCVDVLDKNQNKPVEPEVISGLKASTEELRHLVFEAGNKSSNESDLFSLNCVANSVITMIKWRFPKSSIQCEIEPGIMIKGNRLYFEEALRCVATNAIEAYSSKNSPRHLSLLARKRRNQIQIDVVDLGSGISDSARRFALLGGVSYKNRGSGIGLGFCKYTIEKVFHGKMTISSQGGIGTRVTWHLPLN